MIDMWWLVNIIAGLGLAVVGAHVALAIAQPQLCKQRVNWVARWVALPIFAVACLMVLATSG